MTAIHDLTKKVLQVFPWNPVIGLQVVVKDIAGDDKVSCVVRVSLVPALWSKLFPLGHNCMEVAEGEQNRLELCLLNKMFDLNIVDLQLPCCRSPASLG